MENMKSNIAIASADGPRHSFFLDDTDDPYMATSQQKRALYRLLCENVEDGELRELNINQIPYVSSDEAIIWIKELQDSIW